MKNIFFLVCFLSVIHSASFSQRLDSLATMEDLRLAIIDINDRLQLSHHEFSNGLKLGAIGVALLSTAFTVIKPNSDLELIVAFSGSACTILGFTLMIDSHRYFGKQLRKSSAEKSIARNN
jgi:hypothetical protein